MSPRATPRLGDKRQAIPTPPTLTIPILIKHKNYYFDLNLIIAYSMKQLKKGPIIFFLSIIN